MILRVCVFYIIYILCVGFLFVPFLQAVCYPILGSPYQSVAAGGIIFRVRGRVCCRRTKTKTRRVFRYGGAHVKTRRV